MQMSTPIDGVIQVLDVCNCNTCLTCAYCRRCTGNISRFDLDLISNLATQLSHCKSHEPILKQAYLHNRFVRVLDGADVMTKKCSTERETADQDEKITYQGNKKVAQHVLIHVCTFFCNASLAKAYADMICYQTCI